MKLAVCRVALFVAMASLSSQAATPAEDLKTLRASFDNDLLDVIMQSDRAGSALQASYEAGLKKIEASRQKAGDLEGLLLARKELERFQTEKTFAAQFTGESNTNLLSLQNRCQRAEQERKAARSRKILSRLDKYTARLEERKKALTVAGDVDGAVLFNAEMNRAALLPEVKAAKEVISAAAVSSPAKPPAKPEPGERPGATTKIDKRFKVYTGKSAPAPAVDLKRTMLRPTKLASVANKVVVTAQLGSESSIKRSTSRSYYSSSTSKSGSIATHLRIEVRPRTTSETLENFRVCVQYYVKTVQSNQGKVRPRQYRVEVVPLPAIDPAGTTIDFPAISVSQNQYSYRGYSSSTSYGYGEEFYGILVTVFDSNDSIEFQACSASSLEDLAASAMEEVKKAVHTQDIDEARRAFNEAQAEYHRNTSNSTARARLDETRKRLDSLQGSSGN